MDEAPLAGPSCSCAGDSAANEDNRSVAEENVVERPGGAAPVVDAEAWPVIAGESVGDEGTDEARLWRARDVMTAARTGP